MLLSNNGGSSKTYVDDVFSTYLYTGNGSTQTINNGIDLAGKGGLVWQKRRDNPDGHTLMDTARGTGVALATNGTNANLPYGASSFNSDGVTLQNDAELTQLAGSNVLWTFRNADRFFTHTTISHTNGTPTNISLSSLGTVGQVVAKITNTTGDWIVWHRSLTAGNNLRLNLADAQSTTNAWLSVSGTTATLSASAPTGTYVIYAWAHDTSADGIIQCGSFTTDGSGNATVNLGWEPQFVLAKPAVGSGGDWQLLDSMRGYSLSGSSRIAPNTSGAELTGLANNYPTATGFYFADMSSVGYIYLAIRRGPMKPPKSGTEVYNVQAFTNNPGTNRPVGFPVDLVLSKIRAGVSESFSFEDRLRGLSRTDASGSPKLKSASLGAETTAEITTTYEGTDILSRRDASYEGGFTVVRSFLRRAPGFFSSFAYTGTGANRITPHDLAAIPDLLIVKSRSAGTDWQVWCNGLAANEKLVLNSNAGKVTDATAWNSTLPTSTNISLGTASATNANNATFIAYAFSNLPGIQKIGTYVGNGTSGRVIDCGFTTGARFVCIKAVSTTGSWLVSDTARGITSSADPYLQLNFTAAEITTEDWLDPSSVGFIVNNVTSSNANASGVTYMYWAIS